MATVHPSRMGLVPQDSQYPARRRPSPPPPRRRSSSTASSRSRSRSRERARRDRSPRDRDRDRDRGTRRERDGRKERSRSRDGRGRARDDRNGRRRDSPSYGDYKRSSPPPPPAHAPQGQAPWRQQENMYPRRDREQRPSGTGWGGRAGDDFLERCVGVCKFSVCFVLRRFG
jgi:hypothetical protein